MDAALFNLCAAGRGRWQRAGALAMGWLRLAGLGAALLMAAGTTLPVPAGATQPAPASGAQSEAPPADASAAPAFSGLVGRSRDESVPAWPARPSPPEGAPNILIWLLDDAGFAHLEPYGGLIRTPNVQRLAERGLTYANFHSVPLCSPARAALLTGRNHHAVAMGSHIMSPAGFPGYHGRVPASAASFARILRDQGYATYALGKWDQTPLTEASVAGPFDAWPSGQGFERFYGFLGGEAHHFLPSLWSDHSPISPGAGDPDYFLTTDLADKAIEFIGGLRASNPDKPFLMYWATGAVHAPHHAPAEDIRSYAGAFDQGWDEARRQILKRQIALGLAPGNARLTEKRGGIADWADLPEPERRLYARQMEAFAAQLEQADRQFGRILDFLERLGELRNSLVIVTSDNGASAEGGMTGLHNEAVSFNSVTSSFESNNRFLEDWGGPETANHFHAGWAAAGNTPFPYYKHHVDGGGIRVPLVLFWPDGIRDRGIRRQYHHIIDLAPSILEAAGVAAPAKVDGVPQQPFDGLSMGYSYHEADAPSKRALQYYEVWGNRGIYKDGWKAATVHNGIMPWQVPIPGDLDADVWRLYNLNEDFAESRDLAAERPEKLRELQEAWEREAHKHGVFPVDPDRRPRFIAQMNRFGRKESVIDYAPEGAWRVPEALSPPVKNRSFRIRARIEALAGQPLEGVIVAAGGVTGGYALYVDGGYPVYIYNLYNEVHYQVRGERPIAPGPADLEFRFAKNAEGNGGLGELLLNGESIGSAEIPQTVRNSFSIEDGFDIGRDEGSPVSREYQPPFPFTGLIKGLTFDLSDAP